MNTDAIIYPIGTFKPISSFNPSQVHQWIQDIASLPKALESLCDSVSSELLSRPLRPGAWTLRQLIHHIADSHHHSYTRFKWALTEEKPLIKAYDEVSWSVLADVDAPIELSIAHLSAVHGKWVYLLNKMNESDFSKQFQHPESMNYQYLYNTLGAYAWHGKHHLAQLEFALKSFK